MKAILIMGSTADEPHAKKITDKYVALIETKLSEKEKEILKV